MNQFKLLSLCLLISVQAFAGRKQQEPLRNYFKQNIKPVMAEQRKKLDQQMTDDDKKKVAELREKLHQMKQQAGPKKKDCEEKARMDSALRRQLREQHQAIMNEARAMAQKYQTQIQQLYKELEPKREQWRKDLEALRQQQPADTAHCHKHGKVPLRRLFNPAHFILWDPTQDETGDHGTKPNETSTKSELLTIGSVSPNPSHDVFNVPYYMAVDADVVIRVLNQQGNKVKEYSPVHQKTGDYQQQINLEEQKPGIYMVYIVANGQTYMTRLNKI